MGKVAQNSTKYLVEAELSSSGVVEKPDVIGAIFGQTEGLLGEEMDIRELQERGRIGRIDVDVEREEGSSTGVITIPSSLDATNTAILAAALETIERVGPTNATIKVSSIEDRRNSKQEYIRKRAKQLLGELHDEQPSNQKITEEVRQDVRKKEMVDYRGFRAGPEARESDELILVEGRADLINLMKHGVRNAVAIGGTDVPEKISELAAEKDITAFLDGDRGGSLILEELREKADVGKVARAPEGKEVEELGKKKVFEALRDTEPEERVEADAERKKPPEQLGKKLTELVGTRAAHLLDEELDIIERMPAGKLAEADDECHAILVDGELDRSKVETAEELGASYILGMDKGGHATSSEVSIFTREELEIKTEA